MTPGSRGRAPRAHPGRRRRRLPRGDAHDRPPAGGLREPDVPARRPRDGRVPGLQARPRPARPDAARQGRHRRLQGDPGRVRRPDRDADRQGRHRRRGARARVRVPTTTSSSRSSPRSWSRGSGRAYAASTRRPRRRSRSATSRSTSPVTPSRAAGTADQPDAARVRPAGVPGAQAVAGLHAARCCSSRCGATATPPTRGWSTCTSSGCARRSSTTRRTPRSWSPSAASGYKAGTS